MWDERYSTSEFAYGTNANDFLLEEYRRIPANGKVLCLADGEGRNSVFLARQGYQVTAVDKSTVGLQKAKDLATQKGVEIVTMAADLAEYDLGQAEWDGIISISAHVPPEIRIKLHGKMASALKQGGVFLLEAFTPRQLEMPGTGGPPPSQKEMLMSLADLKNELQDLELILAQELDREMSEGPYHHGNCAVVRILAGKS